MKNTNKKITDLEAKMLQGILDSCYHDDNEKIENPVWTFSATRSFDGKQASGVVSSLNKKKLARSVGYGKDETICITQLGFDTLNARA
jgi:hypothetical protein